MSRILAAVGQVLRTAGVGIDSIGAGVQGKCGYVEKLIPTLTMAPFESAKPSLGNSVFVAPNATVMGNVTVGDRSSIWYGSVVRGDVNNVEIGQKTHLLDNVIVHVAKNTLPPTNPRPTIIGSNVIVGHGAVLHACNVGDGCLVGMGSTLLDGVKMEKQSMIAGGALVLSGAVIPTGQVWGGSPAKLMRQMTTEEIDFIIASAEGYVNLAGIHLEENSKTFDQIGFDKNLRRDRLMRDDDSDAQLGIIRDPKTREIKYMTPI